MRPVSSLLAVAPLCLTAIAAPVAAEVLYSNDLGTATQYGTYIVTVNGNGAVEFRTSTKYPDLDSDGQSRLLLYNNASNGRAYLEKTFYAPTFHTLGSPKFSAIGSGYRTTSAASAWVEIGVGGGYLVTDQTQGDVADSSPVPIAAQLTGPAYARLLSVDTRARLEVLSGTVPPGAGRPRMGNFKVEADINPGQAGDRVWIYKNDFGTAAAVDEWAVTGHAITAGAASTARDLDGDDLALKVEGDTTDPFSTTMTVRVDAPSGYRFADPVAQVAAGGDWSNWASRVTLSLSADGADFSEVSAQTGAGTALLTADGTGVAGFEDLSTLWVRIDLVAGNSGGIRPFVENLLVSGELTAIPEPGAVAIATMGGLLMVRRRRDRRV